MNAGISEKQSGTESPLSRAIMAASRIVSPPPKRNAGEWADAERILPPESPEPGPWRTDRVPFWRDIYAAFSDDVHDTVIVACSAQMGKTEGMFNILGHRFDDGPYTPALYVGPTEKQVKSISKDRVDKMLRSTASLWDKTEKGQRYGVFEKFIAGVRLGFAWAGSATELSSHPAGLVMIDERDRMGSDVGDEGDPVSLARARTKNYPNRKIGIFSTPTLWNASPIWALLDDGTLNFWAWPCLGCYRYFVPTLSLLKWPKGCDPDEAINAARVACPHCDHRHDDKDKARQNALGRYIRHRKLDEKETAPFAVLEAYVEDPEPPERRTASFWISGLASPWAGIGEVAKVLIEAYRSGEQERIQAEVNTWGGEPFRISGDAPSWEEVAANRLEYRPLTVPRDVQRITLGADVQKYGIYYVVRGWGYQSESWLLDQDFLAGETEFDPVWQALRNVIQRPVGDKRIGRAFIDSGYRPGDMYRRPDHAVYTFCRSMPGTAFPTKGADSLDAPYKFRNIDYSSGGAVIRGGVRLFHINTDYFKRWIHARVRWPEGQPGGWHLHGETTEDYCRQIVAEELVIKASGRATWLRKSRDNHYLDCEVGATCAAYVENVHKLAPVQDDDERRAESNPSASPKKRDSRFSRREL